MKVGMFCEIDGSISMRRVLAFFCTISAVAVICIGAFNGTMTSVYGGALLLASAIVLLFFTTWEAIKEIVSAARKP